MTRAARLTVGQLATYAGVTARTVRHYHERGLLAEPDRDPSGYRRYGPQAVVDLIRIRTLVDAGVPLSHIETLLAAEPERFAADVAEIDRDLAARIDDLARRRQRIAELAAGDRLVLPAEVVEILDRMRALGHSERMIRIERDSWIMIVALSPESLPEWVAEKNKALDDPEFRRIYLACDAALEWDLRDPRLADLAADIVAWDARRPRHGEDQPETVGLMYEYTLGSAPTWQRLMVLVAAADVQRPR